MNFKEYKQQQKDIHDQIKALKTQEWELIEAYKSQAPLQVGDKVLVSYQNGSDEVCFVSGIKIPWTSNSDGMLFEYEFKKAKKDGTMSTHHFYRTNNIVSITKIS